MDEERAMQRHFTLEYWLDDNWYVGKLKEVPGVFSQGESLEELEDNIRDAYRHDDSRGAYGNAARGSTLPKRSRVTTISS